MRLVLLVNFFFNRVHVVALVLECENAFVTYKLLSDSYCSRNLFVPFLFFFFKIEGIFDHYQLAA